MYKLLYYIGDEDCFPRHRRGKQCNDSLKKDKQSGLEDRIPEGIPKRHQRAQSRTEQRSKGSPSKTMTKPEETRRSKEYLKMGHNVLPTQRHYPQSRDKGNTERNTIGKVRGMREERGNQLAKGYRLLGVTSRRQARDEGHRENPGLTEKPDGIDQGPVKGYRPVKVTP